MGCLQVFYKGLDACLVAGFLLGLLTVLKPFGWRLVGTIASVSDEVGFAIYIGFLFALCLAEVLACLRCVLKLTCSEIAHFGTSEAKIGLSELFPLLISRRLVNQASLSKGFMHKLRVRLPDCT